MGLRHRRHIAAFATTSPRWLAMVVAALLSLTFHTFVVETHVHGGRGAITQAVASTTATPTHHRAHSPAPLDCPDCRELARVGVAIAPAPAVVPLIVAAHIWYAHLALHLLRAWRRSHNWQSRGPPLLL